MASPLDATRIERLLYELCVEQGFCLPPHEQTRLQNNPPKDVDAFTDAVLLAEGLNPQYEKQLRRGVQDCVARHFRAAMLETAHRASSNHRAQIERSSVCGCFYCLRTFAPSAIERWITEPSGAETALCPKCGINSVMGDSSGYELSAEFLAAMHQRWFET